MISHLYLKSQNCREDIWGKNLFMSPNSRRFSGTLKLGTYNIVVALIVDTRDERERMRVASRLDIVDSFT